MPAQTLRISLSSLRVIPFGSMSADSAGTPSMIAVDPLEGLRKLKGKAPVTERLRQRNCALVGFIIFKKWRRSFGLRNGTE